MRLGGLLTAATSLTVQCGPLRDTGQWWLDWNSGTGLSWKQLGQRLETQPVVCSSPGLPQAPHSLDNPPHPARTAP